MLCSSDHYWFTEHVITVWHGPEHRSTYMALSDKLWLYEQTALQVGEGEGVAKGTADVPACRFPS